MKLTASIDLDRVRDQALRDIDLIFSRRTIVSPFEAIRAEKANAARIVLEGGSSPYLEAEAALRGVAAANLASDILGARQRAQDDLFKVELERQQAKASIRTASSQHAIKTIVGRLEGMQS